MSSEFTIAVHAMIWLNRQGGTLDSETLAEKVGTNPVRIRKVMAKMRKKGLVGTKEGTSGGYYMIWRAEEINLRQICEGLGADVVSVSSHISGMKKDDEIARGVVGVINGLYKELNELCWQKLAGITVQEVDDCVRSGSCFFGLL